MNQPQKYSRGLGLISALFFITVTAMLTVAIARSLSSTAAAAGLEIYSLNAFLAAESGAQLGMNALYSPLGGGVCANRTVDLASIGLTDCQSTITCQPEVVGGFSYFTITSAGSCSENGQIMAQRRILVRTQP